MIFGKIRVLRFLFLWPDWIGAVKFGDRPIALFEQPQAPIPVPDFASAVQLTVGQIFSWLEA